MKSNLLGGCSTNSRAHLNNRRRPLRMSSLSLTNCFVRTPFTCDGPERWQLLFQEAATKIMDNIIDLHHDIMFFLVMISTFVFYMLIRIVIAFRVENTETVRTLTLQHHTWMEVI
jgi:heme/copper-type cytochrome/quinol oxidase subunit 2